MKTVGVRHLKFDSVDELLKVKPAPIHTDKLRKRWYGSSSHGKDWFGGGCSNQRQVKTLVKKGWSKGVDAISNFATDIEIKAPTSRKRKVTRNARPGGALDVHAINAGRLSKMWVKRIRQNRRAPKSITLAVNVTAHCGRTQEDLFWRGASALRLADELTKAGYNVQVIAFYYSTLLFSDDGDTHTAISVKVKPFEAPLELNNLASTVGLAGFNRVVLWQGLDTINRPISSGRGMPLESETPTDLQGDMVVDGFGSCESKLSAESFVASVLDRFNF